MEYERPEALRSRLKLGREEYCQRLITSLIVGGRYPRWNTRSQPCTGGVDFLQGLWRLSFAEPWPGDQMDFVDEFELPPRHDDERGGAPDWAVLWPDLAWLIELKTERSSHRKEQIPLYFDLCRYHHQTSRVWITYLTPPADYQVAPPANWARYAHLTWPAIPSLAAAAWGGASGDERAVLDGVLQAIEKLDLAPTAWRSTLDQPVPAETPVEIALRVAEETGRDGQQRAVDWAAPALEALQQLRLDVRSHLAAMPSGSLLRQVMPWLWQLASSGQPLTAAGRVTGYELRMSRYSKDLY